MLYTLRFFSSSKFSLFHNSNVFGSCIIHILYTACVKIKKNNPGAKRLKTELSKPLNINHYINTLTPNDHYSGRTAPLTSKVQFNIFIQRIYVSNILNVVYTLHSFLFKMQFVS